MTRGRLLAVTGANGYIGRRLTALALAQGWSVLSLGRRPPPCAGVAHLQFELGGALPRFPASPDALIHLACDTTGADAERLDLPTARLLASAFAAGPTRLVFVSSQTADAGAATTYGRAKAAVEDVLRPAGAIIVRPGLVYGGPPAGLWGAMLTLVKRLPAVPALIPPPRVQPIHVDDLCQALLAAAQGAGKPGQTLAIAAPDAVSITDFLRAMAREVVRRPRVVVPTPTGLLVAAAVGLSAVLPGLRPRAQQLRSLAGLRPMATAADLATVGITPRPLESGMGGRLGTRRARLAEGARLLRHILGRAPPTAVLRRYVRATESLGLAPVERSVLRSLTLRLYAPSLSAQAVARLGLPEDLPLRLHLALVAADASPATARLFHRTERQGAPAAFVELLANLIGEAPFLFWRIIRGRTGIGA